MKQFIILLIFLYTENLAQEPESFFQHNVGNGWEYGDSSDESFFPHHVGDIWDYWVEELFGSAYLWQKQIYKDSIGLDGSHNLFYNNFYRKSLESPEYRIDTALNVFWMPQDPYLNFLYYKLEADTGIVWENPNSSDLHWAWVAKVDSGFLFSHPTIRKIFRYGPGYPDSANSQGLLEDWLVSGFGLIYSGSENYIISLRGCIIAGDTFGIVTSVNSIEKQIPDKFVLKQNYPNPFNPGTTIEIELPREAEVSINVYDILGRQIAELFEGKKDAGTHKVFLNAEGLASGIYFCRLQASENVRTIKMILTK